ncbi:LEM domain-containing protein 1 isoform X1 [Canis lupus familiaris]|uniref:LEM domain containing 1 n=1 Tax=Canis lupus familiaris TaxID=9615 RepID=A0A8C0MTL9_CANLF|nr:LEM domain-containing protein 1 isoform X1 [Canis lupus familiaris]XP_038441956.1 LEM domain-containing protein 1 isoform X1 [Canis lupus familiaris]|eukprot:XP_005640847.1 LEM domain-containing protein 1 isoform X1 [Canis lupus familiaris]
MVDVKSLSDYELQNELNKLGFSPGPILPSTRKVYEKKLVQLLVSPPCASTVMNGPCELDRAQDDDDSEELNVTIILKGNIILSSEKNKALKKNPVFEIQEQQEEIMKSNSDYSDNMIIKRLEASNTNPEALDIYYLAYKHPEGIRFPNRASNTRFEGWSCIRETDYCPVNRSVEFGNLEILPVGLKLAVFGIFIIVIFVYITVEKEPFFG